jgi:hypothetical protein
MAGKMRMPVKLRNWRMRKGVYRHEIVENDSFRGVERRNE